MKSLAINNDGITLYGEENNMIYFDDWLKNVSDWGASREVIRNYMICGQGYSSDTADERIDELEEDFYSYCENNGYTGETD